MSQNKPEIVSLAVTFDTIEGLEQAVSQEVSKGGLFVSTKTLPELFEQVRVKLIFGNESTTLQGRVVAVLGDTLLGHSAASRDSGVAVEFVNRKQAVEVCQDLMIKSGYASVNSISSINLNSKAALQKRAAAKEAVHQAKNYLERLPKDRYYKILGVHPDSNDETIRKAYIKLSRRFHPDSHRTVLRHNEESILEDAYRRVQEAYGVLSVPGTRSEYDKKIGVVHKKEEEEISDVDPEILEKRKVIQESFTLKRVKMLHAQYKEDYPQKMGMAHNYYQEALEHLKQNTPKEALSKLKLAVAFAPFSTKYHSKMVQVKKAIAEEEEEE